MKLKIKNSKEEKELVFELVQDSCGDISLEVNGKQVVQFISNDECVEMYTNFYGDYGHLKINKK